MRGLNADLQASHSMPLEPLLLLLGIFRHATMLKTGDKQCMVAKYVDSTIGLCSCLLCRSCIAPVVLPMCDSNHVG